MSASIAGAYLPDYSQQANTGQSTVFAGESSIVGVCGFLAAVYVGVLCERLFARTPAISLYTTSIGSIAASAFMALAVYSAVIVQASDARYRLSVDGSSLNLLAHHWHCMQKGWPRVWPSSWLFCPCDSSVIVDQLDVHRNWLSFASTWWCPGP